MKTLFVYLVAVLFVSGKNAIRVNLQDDIEGSNETQNIDNDIKPGIEMPEQSVNEIPSNRESNNSEELEVKQGSVKEVHSDRESNISEELELESIRRSKKSYYPQRPCPLCGYSGNQHSHSSIPLNSRPHHQHASGGYPSQRPTYEHTQYHPNSGGSHKNIYPKPAPHPYHHAPASVPAYSAHTYDVPSYPQPAYKSYNYNKYTAPVYPIPSNGYYHPQTAHHKLAPSQLLIGCHPHVSSVSDYSSHYDSIPYGPPAQHVPLPYRFNSPQDAALSIPEDSPKSSIELMPEKITLLDNTSSKGKSASSKDHSVSQPLFTTNDSKKSETNDEITKKANTFEEVPLKKHETLFDMAQRQRERAQMFAAAEAAVEEAQRKVTGDDKQKNEKSTGKIR